MTVRRLEEWWRITHQPDGRRVGKAACGHSPICAGIAMSGPAGTERSRPWSPRRRLRQRDGERSHVRFLGLSAYHTQQPPCQAKGARPLLQAETDESTRRLHTTLLPVAAVILLSAFYAAFAAPRARISSFARALPKTVIQIIVPTGVSHLNRVSAVTRPDGSVPGKEVAHWPQPAGSDCDG